MKLAIRGPIRIGILAPEFLINIGANDFLKNIIRGLAQHPQAELVFLCPHPHERIEQVVSASTKERLKRIPYLKDLARAVVRLTAPATNRIVPSRPAGTYDFYGEACPTMRFVVSATDPDSLRRLRTELGIDVFLPSIHALGDDIPYVTYWPDCQPKHYPEFFNDEAQRARDQRIQALLDSGKPMIINSRDAKGDMQRFYGAAPTQIFELPFAPIIEFDKVMPRPELANRYRLERPYVIVCNQFWVHKSIETVIQAAHELKKRRLPVKVVFTGKMEEPRRPAYIDGLRQLTADLAVEDVVTFLGYIPKDDQLELMKNALAVVQPTLFEGGPGGGSIYDAVSLGIRGIVSDIAINHELPIAPGRLELFRTRDPNDLVDHIEAMLRTPYRRPSPEDLYQANRQSARLLAGRLYEAIAYARPDLASQEIASEPRSEASDHE